jgi:nicotinic acid mononucleotide adenylyltransferase
MCGADHAAKCGLNQSNNKYWCDGVVVASRPGKTLGKVVEDSEYLMQYESSGFMVVPDTTGGISSTMVRNALVQGNIEHLKTMVHPSTVEYMAKNNLTFVKRPT